MPLGVLATERLTDFRITFVCERDCDAGLQDIDLRANDLTIERLATADGRTTRLDGDLTLRNLATKERFGRHLAAAAAVSTGCGAAPRAS